MSRPKKTDDNENDLTVPETADVREAAPPQPDGVEIHLLSSDREPAESVFIDPDKRRYRVSIGGRSYHHVDTVGDIWRYAPED